MYVLVEETNGYLVDKKLLVHETSGCMCDKSRQNVTLVFTVAGF